ncbi:MAG: hypothetical protein L6R40_000561 [Gallowayella cf. fulva]|nr:MAG: hypothetical protein L6R40_000561 [Xanthomendoza cf. fulva]
MCIHHVLYHAPCGHTKQLTTGLVYCDPVAKAIKFYHDQPKLAAAGIGRYHTEPMKPPQPCGGRAIKLLRQLPPSAIVGQDRTFAPSDWQREMTDLVKKLLEEREDTSSIIAILTSEYPQLTEKVSERWIHYLQQCFQNPDVTWSPPEDLDNEHYGGDIVTETVAKGCGRQMTMDPRCGEGWDNPYGGGKVFCSYIFAQEIGQPMPRWRECDTSDPSFKAGNDPQFHHQSHREMKLQAWNCLKDRGLDFGNQPQGYASLELDPQFLAALVKPDPNTTEETDDLVTDLIASTAKDHCWPPSGVSGRKKSSSDNGHDKDAGVNIERGRSLSRTVPATERASTVAIMEFCECADCGYIGEQHD